MHQEAAIEPAVIPSPFVRKVSWHRGRCPACRLSSDYMIDARNSSIPKLPVMRSVSLLTHLLTP